ncbi:hypothetical protein ACQ86N_36060 [Puia sp. P3]|uniref:hypothetical protein n=1 Tax=Puia sp. P3 TaxID=3423952 RepID=UPI003D678D4B
MISDPKTSPNHPLARVLWAAGIAIIAFYLSAFKWLNNTPVWLLAAAAPLVPLLDHIFRAHGFDSATPRHEPPGNPPLFSKLKQLFMRTKTRKLTAMVIMIAMVSNESNGLLRILCQQGRRHPEEQNFPGHPRPRRRQEHSHDVQ